MADRFVALDSATALDLATGDRVLFKQIDGDETAAQDWLANCAARLERRQTTENSGGTAGRSSSPALRTARLVDFGTLERGVRFEAWECGGADAAPSEGDCTVDHGLAAIADAIDCANGARPRVLAIDGADPRARRELLLYAARHARLRGYIPISSAVATNGRNRIPSDALHAVLNGRSLFVIHDGAAGTPGEALVEAVLHAARPHVLVFSGHTRSSGFDTIVLRGIGRSAVVEQHRLRAAEQPAGYGAGRAADFVPAGLVKTEWSAASDVGVWRRRIGEAHARIAASRYASGERLLREAIGGLWRRNDWASAGEALNSLARRLLARGRPRDALATIERARQALGRVHDEAHLIDAAILAGRARMQLAAVQEAETILSGALTASRLAGDAARGSRAAASLALCLAWQGRYAEANEAIERKKSDDTDRCPGCVSAQVMALIGLGRPGEALAIALKSSAANVDGKQSAARAAVLTAFARLAVGDLEQVQRDIAGALASGNRTGDRMLVLRSRLIAAEALRRLHRRDFAAGLVRRFAKVRDGALTPLLRAHVRLMTDLLAESEDPLDVAHRHAKATGLGALQLFVPASSAPGDPRLVDGFVEILQLCQSADDEAAVLAEVCRRSRSSLRAAAVAAFGRQGGAMRLIASDGARLDATIAERAVAAGIVIPPHQCEERIESAAPVKYAGETIGALAVRWSLGSPYSRASAPETLSFTAAALAPALAAALVHRATPAPSGLLGISAAARELHDAIERAASAPFPVLVEGESGSGKELVARALHRRGIRRDRPFCTLNCAALPDELIESELFGHARGSFTGAIGDRPGVFEEAHGGTLLLDEIGELSPRAQAKVLRVIQEGEVRRVGENVPRRVDVRLVAATNRDLRRDADAGRFRTDLLYRLDVVRITVRPLRERRDDIPLLVDHFWREATQRMGSRAVLNAATIAALARHEWPGNVRELQNVLASLAVRVGRRGTVSPAALPPLFDAGPARTSCRLEEARRTFETQFVRAALARTGGRRAAAAAELGLSRQGLTKLLARLGLQPS